jgi:hypothetical protein
MHFAIAHTVHLSVAILVGVLFIAAIITFCGSNMQNEENNFRKKIKSEYLECEIIEIDISQNPWALIIYHGATLRITIDNEGDLVEESVHTGIQDPL